MTTREVGAQETIFAVPPRRHNIHREGVQSRRPRLIFLAYPFPPLKVTACVRTANIAKYLARLGWEITVVTPHPSVWRHVENSQKTDAALERQGIKRILTKHRWRWLSPDHVNCWNQGLGWLMGGACRRMGRLLGVEEEIGWLTEAERACSTLTGHDVDVILATGSPFITFRLAKRLADRLGRPYVLDYRDPWTGNPHVPHPARPAAIQEEARLLAGCAAVTIVSTSLGLAMEGRFGLGPKLHVITNGYDPEELAGVEPHDFGHFALVYTGNFYPPQRVISPVMAALKRLKETPAGKNGTWYFHYYGGEGNHVRAEAQRFGVTDRVVLHSTVPRAEALAAVRGAGIAIVIASVAENAGTADKGIVTGKVFEALGLRTPTLLVAPSGSDVEGIAETTGLARSFAAGDVESMTAFLVDVMSGRTLTARDLRFYTWESIAERLDVVLRNVAVKGIRGNGTDVSLTAK